MTEEQIEKAVELISSIETNLWDVEFYFKSDVRQLCTVCKQLLKEVDKTPQLLVKE